MVMANEARILGMMGLWKAAFLVKQRLDYQYGILCNATNKARAREEITKLTFGIKENKEELWDYMACKYSYVPDRIDIPTDPLVTAFTKKGDCEDFALLINKIYPSGKIINILQLYKDGGYKGHIVYWDKDGDVWSAESKKKGLVIGMRGVTEVKKIAKFYNKKYTNIVQFDKNINVVEIS